MSLLEILRDPALMQNMTANEKIIAGVQVAILGITIVFIILGLLMITIKIMESLFSNQDDINKYKENKSKDDSLPDEGKINSKALTEQVQEDEEVVAVITAALSQYYFQSSQFKVKRITRLSDGVPVWGRIGRVGEDFNKNNK